MSIGRAARRRACSATAAVLVTLTGVAPGFTAAPAVALAPVAKGDQAIQRTAVLKRSDLPAGWTAGPRGDSEPSAAAACQGIEAVNAALRPRSTRSPDFTKSDLIRVNNSVVVLESTKQAKRYLEPYRAPEAVTCLESVMRDAFTSPGIASMRVSVTPTDEAPSGANEAAGFNMLVTVTTTASPQQPAQTLVLYWDLMVVRVGRALSNFAFLNPGKSLPEMDEVMDAVVGRLQDAL